MKLRLTLASHWAEASDITLSCSVAQTVAETARTLILAGVEEDSELKTIAARRLAPVTLIGRPAESAAPVMLDPGAPIGASGLQSGWIVEAVEEFGPQHATARVIPVAGYAEVLTGRHAGTIYSLIPGSNHIGRDRASRVYLGDASVSRRHAVVEIGHEIVLRDLGSANGLLIDGERIGEARIDGPCTVQLGETALRITPGPPPQEIPQPGHKVMHTRSPRVGPRFPQTERELPAPPAPAAAGRVPLLAMLAPMMLGGAMFLITNSPMSLMMVAFTPMMMIGSWLDGRTTGRRKLRNDLRRFQETLAAEREELVQLRHREIEVRSAETPAFSEIAAAIADRDGLLWTRRPEHRSFLEVRFGEGILPSRTRLKLPTRGETAAEQWKELCEIEGEFAEVSPVPVLERLDRCGSIGVAGEPIWAEGLARALVLQLVGLHSPAELALAGFVGPGDAEDWEWLKWLPHIDSVTSPIPCWPLADDEASSTRLITALEGLLETRRASRSGRSTVRSHLDAETLGGDAQDEAVAALPITPAVVVLVLDDHRVETSRLIALAEQGPDLGIHLIWAARERASVPAACRTFVELGQAEGTVSFVRTGERVRLQRIEQADTGLALDLARRLSPVEDTGARVLDESDLPKAVDLRELHPIDLLGGSGAIAQAWAGSGSLTSAWVSGAEREAVGLAAVVGQSPEGPAVIDLRAHGPHALVGGTTGAGKSEFLQSWIMSLAASISPDRLTFLLVDYKGGAAFAECTELPHTVGLVTDLSPHLVRRALTSLRAELRYREELLAAHGAKDLIAMERRSEAAAPPALIIVIDEFAALAKEIPEFVDGVIDIAQRGRSLGLHLIMATQRPAGVIKDNLRANTNLRVALRMADEADSSDVIGVKDAAFFGAETPGRGAIKVGPGRIAHFQTGYLGGRASAAVTASRLEVRPLGFTEGAAWDLPPEREESPARKSPRDIEVLRDGIIAAAVAARIAPPRRPWLDALPERLDLQRLLEAGGDGPGDVAVIGLRDEPDAQVQRPVAIDFEEVGNISILGAGGTGKTSALLSLAASLSSAGTSPVQLYGIDAAGGALDALTALPTVGAVAPLGDLELTERVLRRVLDVIAERGPRFAAARAGGLRAYRGTLEGAAEPRVILLLDGFAAFRQTTETLGGRDSLFQLLGEIMTTGRSVGVHAVLTGDRPSSIPAAMASTLQQQYVLRLAASHDYGYLGVSADALDEAPPGRALLAGENDEIQFALVGGEPELAAQAAAIESLAHRLRQQDVPQAPQVRNAPALVPLAELPAEIEGRPVFGIDTRTLEPIGMPLGGLGVLSGPAGSGLSTAARSCVAGLRRWASERGEAVESVLLTFVREGLRSEAAWDRVAYGEEEIGELARELTVALGGRPAARPAAGLGGLIGGAIGGPIGGPIGGATAGSTAVAAAALGSGEAGDERPVFPRPGARGIIVVERPADAEGTSALPELVALARAARRAEVLVLFEFEQGTGGGIWDLFSALKQPGWGLSLQPDEAESQSPFRETLGRVKRADFPPGRGFAIESGRVTAAHVAMSAG
ncbi:MAG: FtsK/SpoIIIE domain-containing protein [Leucobacter sp.]